MSSRLPGFYRQTVQTRQNLLVAETPLVEDDIEYLSAKVLTIDTANLMIENVVGTFGLPMAVGVNIRVNEEDVIVPMVVEEPSILAAVSNMSKLVRQSGGFTATSTPSNMIGQIQLSNVPSPQSVIEKLSKEKQTLVDQANEILPSIRKRGGGVREMHFREVHYDEPGESPTSMVVIHFIMDCVDAMGANMINTVAEQLSPMIEHISGHPVNLRILSNYATERLAKASCAIPFNHLSNSLEDGRSVAEGIVDAYRFAYADPWRAATHNKGIMNGIDPVVIATGNDWRAVEAGAHAWASRTGQYRSLTKWFIRNETLYGELEMPMQVGTVGGCIRTHPQVQTNMKMLGHPKARELAQIIVSVGLAQNLGALNALSTEGIQRGHMKMHARNIATQAGATIEEVPLVVEALSKAHAFSVAKAKEVLLEIRTPS